MRPGATSKGKPMSTEATTNLDESCFTASVRDALLRIGSDGRLSPSDARAFRRFVAKLPAAGRSTWLSEPDRIFGPFDSLPWNAQRAVVEMVASDDHWRMAAYSLGVLHAPLSRGIRRLLRRLPVGHLAQEADELFAAGLRVGPARAVYAVHRISQALRAQFSRRPKLGDSLAGAGAEIRNLAVCYARGIPQPQKFRGFWHDPERHTTAGLLVGLDLIENAEGYWFVESNMDCGLGARRTAVYEEDPLASSLVHFAAVSGYRRLIVLTGSSPVNPEMARQLHEKAAARNLALTLLEDPFRFGSRSAKGAVVPELDGPNTLLVRNKHYRTNIDYVVQHKGASGRALRVYKEESGDLSFQLPRTSTEPCPGPTNGSDPFPNLVFKFPTRDFGQGVFFLKVESASQVRDVLAETLRFAPTRSVLSRLHSRLEREEGLYQEYIRTPMDSDRRLCKVRAFALLSPIGPQFLSAVRCVGAKPVPESLPMGVVHDRGPYLVNAFPPGRFEVLCRREEPGVRQAALGAARGLSWALSRGFENGPESAA